MKKFSLVLAAAVMAVGLAVSGSASAEDDANEILSEGKILHAANDENGTYHYFTVAYDRLIYVCRTSTRRADLDFASLRCRKTGS